MRTLHLHFCYRTGFYGTTSPGLGTGGSGVAKALSMMPEPELCLLADDREHVVLSLIWTDENLTASEKLKTVRKMITTNFSKPTDAACFTKA